MSIQAKFSTESSFSPITLLNQARDLLQNSEQLCQARLFNKRRELAGKIKHLKAKAHLQAKNQAIQKVQLQRLKDFLNLKQSFDEKLIDLERDYAELALRICEKIIAEQISFAHSGLLSKIKEITAHISSNHSLQISINPCHLEYFINELGEKNVIADSTIESGNAKITLATGQIFINWRDQLQTLISELKQHILK